MLCLHFRCVVVLIKRLPSTGNVHDRLVESINYFALVRQLAIFLDFILCKVVTLFSSVRLFISSASVAFAMFIATNERRDWVGT